MSVVNDPSNPGSKVPTRNASQVDINMKGEDSYNANIESELESDLEIPWPLWNSGPVEMCINGMPISMVLQNVHTQLEILRARSEKPLPPVVVEEPKIDPEAIIGEFSKLWSEEKSLLEGRILALESAIEQNEVKAAEKEAKFRELINADAKVQQNEFELKMKKVIATSIRSISVEIHKEMAVAADKIEENFGGRINTNRDNVVRVDEALQSLKSDIQSKNTELKLRHDDIDDQIKDLVRRFESVDALALKVTAIKTHTLAMQEDLNFISPIVRQSTVTDLVTRCDEIERVNVSIQRQCSNIASMNDRIREDLSIYMQRFKQSETERVALNKMVQAANQEVNSLVLGVIPEMKSQLTDISLKKADVVDMRAKADIVYVDEVRDYDGQYTAELAKKVSLLQDALLKQDELVTTLPIELYKNLDNQVEQLTKWCETQIRANNEMLFNFQKAKARDDHSNAFPAQVGAQSALGVRCLSCKQPVMDVTHDTGNDHDHLLLTSTLPLKEGSPSQTRHGSPSQSRHGHGHGTTGGGGGSYTHEAHVPHTPYFNANTTVVGDDQQKLLQEMLDAAAQSNKSNPAHGQPPKFSKLVRLLAVTNEQVECQSPVGKTGSMGGGVHGGANTVLSQMTDEGPVSGGLTIMDEGQYRSPLDTAYSSLVPTGNSSHGSGGGAHISKVAVLNQIQSSHRQKDFVSWRPLMAADASTRAIDKVLHPGGGNSKMQLVKTLSDSQFAEVNRALHGNNANATVGAKGAVGNVRVSAPVMGTGSNHLPAAGSSTGAGGGGGVIRHGGGGNAIDSNKRPTSAPSIRRNH